MNLYQWSRARMQPLRRRVLHYSCMFAGLWVIAALGHPAVVMGASMEPFLHTGQLLWVDRNWYRHRVPAPGEVVVFRHGGETYVKRVFRGPGDRVHYVASRGSWAVGPVRESDLQRIRERLSRQQGTALTLKTYVVPEGHVFVVGDNPGRSEDSRTLGPIAIEEILGRASAPVEPTALSYYRLPHFRSGPQISTGARKQTEAGFDRRSGVLSSRGTIEPSSAVAAGVRNSG